MFSSDKNSLEIASSRMVQLLEEIGRDLCFCCCFLPCDPQYGALKPTVQRDLLSYRSRTTFQSKGKRAEYER